MDRRNVRLLDFESFEKILGSTTIPHLDLLDMEERLARCLSLSHHARLKVKVLYLWVVVMYRPHKHADLINIIDRLDSMMGRTEATQECYNRFGTKELQSIMQQVALRHDMTSLMSHVALVRANLRHQLTSICWASGTESCAAHKTNLATKCGDGSASDVPVDVQRFTKQQVASMDGRNIATSCHILEDAASDGAVAVLPLHGDFDLAKKTCIHAEFNLSDGASELA